jgi:hypothetical protein
VRRDRELDAAQLGQRRRSLLSTATAARSCPTPGPVEGANPDPTKDGRAPTAKPLKEDP